MQINGPQIRNDGFEANDHFANMGQDNLHQDFRYTEKHNVTSVDMLIFIEARTFNSIEEALNESGRDNL